ncbi:hypothetical protein BD769DRAFT_1391855 [Suillus cothurnatus]|nr:hypothetical protein BD769DRAFT_1391855 [Suillus cothurnatus]
MSTVVTRVEHSFYPSLVPKTCKSYQARPMSSTTPHTSPVLTESDHHDKLKYNNFRYSSLPSPNSAGKGASPKISLPAEEVGQTKSTGSVPTIPDALCGDAPKKSLHSEVLTSSISWRETGRIQVNTTCVNEAKVDILHKASFDYLKNCLMLAIAQLPYDRDLVYPSISMNYPLKIKGGVVNPDMTITITAVEEAPSVVLVPGVVECAVSEDRVHIFNKVENEIEAHLDALIGGHNWCHIQSVEYFVWVKGNNQDHIDIHDDNPQFMAYGTLAPTLNMDAVTTMLERGVHKIRDTLVSFSRQLSDEVDCSNLENALVTLPIVWRLGAKNMMTAADLTAHQCYDLWHEEVIRGTKHSYDNESYTPTKSQHSSSDSQVSATISSQESLINEAACSARAGNGCTKHVKCSVTLS